MSYWICSECGRNRHGVRIPTAVFVAAAILAYLIISGAVYSYADRAGWCDTAVEKDKCLLLRGIVWPVALPVVFGASLFSSPSADT